MTPSHHADGGVSPAAELVHGEGRAVAAEEKDGGVDRPVDQRVVLDAEPEAARVLDAVSGVEREEAGEEEKLAREKEPHPEARGVRLPLEVLEALAGVLIRGAGGRRRNRRGRRHTGSGSMGGSGEAVGSVGRSDALSRGASPGGSAPRPASPGKGTV